MNQTGKKLESNRKEIGNNQKETRKKWIVT